MSQKVIAIFGLGTFGTNVAESLHEHDVQVIAIDLDENLVDDISEKVTEAVIGDFTDRDLLRSLDIQNCDAVVLSSATAFESQALALLHAIELGVPNIICKAKDRNHAKILNHLGATEIVMPEIETGIRVAHELYQAESK